MNHPHEQAQAIPLACSCEWPVRDYCPINLPKQNASPETFGLVNAHPHVKRNVLIYNSIDMNNIL